ncbi:peripheral myelin protein 22-like [Saccostrea echinata]|uniref:peripheral myelin protein 22-like n=1 Tax=Saccostrea echinata TaxID=191078 RepID=UPI002A7EA8B8|nr:peripheral myelin protein 22-like [Saccostrea echinata]
MEASKFLLIALVLTICAVVFQLIGLASPYWILVDSTTMKTNAGLWKSCTETFQYGITVCMDTEEDWLKAVRAMSILASLVLVVAAIMAVLKLFVLKDMKPILFVGIGTAFAGAVFILISIAVYSAKLNDLYANLDFNYHFAFAFSIMGMIAAIGGGVVMLVEIMKG